MVSSVGKSLVLQGLKSRADLNGQRVVVLQEGDRWRCQVLRTGERIRVNPSCFTSVDARPSLYASRYPSLQEAVDDAAPGTIIELGTNYDEIVHIRKPISLVGTDTVYGIETQQVRISGVVVDIQNDCDVELVGLDLGSDDAWKQGCGLRVFDGSPIVVQCNIRGMVALRVDSFSARSSPALLNNCFQGRLGGIWWEGACWTMTDAAKAERNAVCPSVGGLPPDVLDVVARNRFIGDVQWVCSTDRGVAVLAEDGSFVSLDDQLSDSTCKKLPSIEDFRNSGWLVCQPSFALMDRGNLLMQRAAWEQLASEAENDIRRTLDVQNSLLAAQQLRQWRCTGEFG